MSIKKCRWQTALLVVITLIWGLCIPALAEGLSNDNSLSSLGILTEGAEVSPEFQYGRTEYDVTVPAGTTQLELEPVPSNGNATIANISGTEIVDGTATVEIDVAAENGEQYPYYLHVTTRDDGTGAAAVAGQVEKETEPQTEAETEPETEDPRYVKVDRNSLQEAENTISALKTETSSYRDRVGILMKILYGMIAFCVVLLFIVINLLLKKKDLKAELNEYRSMGYPQETSGSYSKGQEFGSQEFYSNAPSDQQGYPGYGQDAYSQQDYSQNMQETPAMQEYRQAPVKKDDPTTVPKPSKAKKKPKKMSEYEQVQQEYTYQQPAAGRKEDKNVEVTMIDL